MPQIHHLSSEFIKYGFLPCYQAEYWLPDVDVLKETPCRYETRILEQKDFSELYSPEWSNALSQSENSKRLDMLGVGAYDNGKLVGLSGCSADCDTMWQIGIDVLPEYHRKGIAAALTSRLAIEVINREKVPFYCCAWSNLGSVRNAIKSGFRPAWVEHTAIETEKALEWNSNKHFQKRIKNDNDYWSALDKLDAESKIVIDRPKGNRHPKYPKLVYPVDYGYLENTSSMDGNGIDVWKGKDGDYIDAIICTVDLMKRDSEIKILIGCTEDEKRLVLDAHNNSEYMKGILIRRDNDA
jgi:GNAT superfamily N-acetyltransferase